MFDYICKIIKDDEFGDDGNDDSEEFWMAGEYFNFDFLEEIPAKSKNKNGCICTECSELYPYAEPNQPDGTLICYSCRRFIKK